MTVSPKALDSLAQRAKIQTICGILWMTLLVVLELSLNIGIDLILNALVFLVVSVLLVPTIWYFDQVHGKS